MWNASSKENKIICVEGQLYKEEQWVHKEETQFDKNMVCLPEYI